MSINYINTGSSANKGDGDTLRTAFNKINANFRYLSTFTGVDLASNITPAADDTYTLGTSSTVWKSLYVGALGINLNGNVLTVNTAGSLILNGSTITGTGSPANLSLGPIVGTTTDPFTLLVQASSLNFGTITNPGSLGFNAGTII